METILKWAGLIALVVLVVLVVKNFFFSKPAERRSYRKGPGPGGGGGDEPDDRVPR